MLSNLNRDVNGELEHFVEKTKENYKILIKLLDKLEIFSAAIEDIEDYNEFFSQYPNLYSNKQCFNIEKESVNTHTLKEHADYTYQFIASFMKFLCDNDKLEEFELNSFLENEKYDLRIISSKLVTMKVKVITKVVRISETYN